MRVPFAFTSRERSYPLLIYIDTTRKAIDCATTLPLTVFNIMKLCSRLFVLYCRNCPKDDKFSYFVPHFEEVRGSVEPCWMARWKARVEFLLSVIEFIFLSLAVEALQGKMCQNSLPSGGGWSLGATISGGKGSSPANILIPLVRQLIAIQFAADSFYTMKLCSRLFVLYCRNCPKDDKFRYFIPILRKLGAA